MTERPATTSASPWPWGQVEEAIEEFGRALDGIARRRESPQQPRQRLGQLRAGDGQAISQFQRALEIANDAGSHYNLANLLVGKGLVVEAITHYRKALEIKPDYVERA